MKDNNLLERLEKAEKDADYERQKRKEIEIKYYELLNELKKTQALIRQFLNENTPSSKLPFKTKINEIEKEPKPRGKPIGSNGGNKEAPENVDRKIKAKLERRCPRCGKIISIRDIDTRLRYVYDAIIKAIVIEVEEEIYPCDCGEFCIGTHPDIP